MIDASSGLRFLVVVHVVQWSLVVVHDLTLLGLTFLLNVS